MLKRIHYPSVQPTDLFLGATINVFSRKLQIVAYTDLGTKKFMEGQTSRAVGVMGLPSADALGHVLDALMGACRITAAKTVAAADVGLGAGDAPSGLALCVEAVTHTTDAPAILGELLDALAADGLVGGYAPSPTDADALPLVLSASRPALLGVVNRAELLEYIEELLDPTLYEEQQPPEGIKSIVPRDARPRSSGSPSWPLQVVSAAVKGQRRWDSRAHSFPGTTAAVHLLEIQ